MAEEEEAAEGAPAAEAAAAPDAAAAGPPGAGHPQAGEPGIARWVPHPAAVAASAAPQWARRVEPDAECDASQGPAPGEAEAGLPCRANQAPRGVAAAASSPAQFCLIGVTWRVNAEFVPTAAQMNTTSRPVSRVLPGSIATVAEVLSPLTGPEERW